LCLFRLTILTQLLKNINALMVKNG
jgi:hypothetical protein